MARLAQDLAAALFTPGADEDVSGFQLVLLCNDVQVPATWVEASTQQWLPTLLLLPWLQV